MTQEMFALAFVHLPTGEVGRSEFIFSTRDGAQAVADELDKETKTILHFVVGERDDLRVVMKERKDKHDRR
jgi:hypothetical protein